MRPLNWEQAERERQREARRVAADLRRARRANVVAVPRNDPAAPDDADMPDD
jgi:hypothetical protein